MKKVLVVCLLVGFAGCVSPPEEVGSQSGALGGARGGFGGESLMGPISCLDPTDQVGANFGASVGWAGDINKDGFADLIIGAPLWNSNQYTDEGKVWVYFCSATGPGGTPWTADPANQVGAWFGTTVASGDVNGDGYPDVVLGAPRWDGSATAEGRVYVYHGSATGLPSSPSTTRDPTDQANAWFGQSVAVGDVNGDGKSDVLVGAPGFDGAGGADRGEAYVYLGSASGIGATPAWTSGSMSIAGAPQMGQSVAVADVNGDNIGDLLVGLPGYDGTAVDEGALYVFLGSEAGPTATPVIYEPTDQAGANFGAAVASAGDIGCDGHDGVVVGAPGWDGQQQNEGRAFLYLGGDDGLGSNFIWSADPTDQAQALFGSSVALADDLNGDGRSEFLVGAPGTTDGGRVYVYSANARGVSATPLRIEVGGQTGARFGASVASAHDIDADGLPDIVTGAPGWDSTTHVDEGETCWYKGAWAHCGDAVCEAFEDACNCPADCGTDTCGNGVCCPPETGATCPADCPACGNGRCDSGEDTCTCPVDCGVSCGDRCCNGGETTATCQQDCGTCPDGACRGDETAANCPEDCDTGCGDGVCTEGCLGCPKDCGAVCGDGCCGPNENTCNCSADCGSICGDDCCNGTDSADADSADYCPMDCGTLSPPGKLGSVPGTTVVVTNSADANADGLPESVTLQGGSCGSPLTIPLAPGQSTAACGICIVVGTAADDMLTITPGCVGLAFGGPGNDEIVGSSMGNLLYGGPGNDRLMGGSSADRLVGDDGADSLAGGPGNDLLFGGKGNDILHGDAGADLAYGGDGMDYVDGATGDDTLFGGADDDCLSGGPGNDFMRTSNGNDTALGGCGKDIIRSEAGRDYVLGDGRCKSGDPGETNATCPGDCPIPVCPDGLCNGSETQASCPADCTCNTNGVCDAGETACKCPADCTTPVCGDGCCTGSETWSTCFSDCCNPNGVCDPGYPGAGDCIDAGAGWDRVHGQAGDDTIWGQAGRDELHGDSGADKISGGYERDWLYGESGADTLDAYWTAPDKDTVIPGCADSAGDTIYYNSTGDFNTDDFFYCLGTEDTNLFKNVGHTDAWDDCACGAASDCLGGLPGQPGGGECYSGKDPLEVTCFKLRHVGQGHSSSRRGSGHA
jgi:FG-GAP repeat protein/hemolysin type calcium-binding protein